MRFAERMDRFGEGIFSKLLEIKRQKEERGETVIDLGVGAPNIPPARHITDALCRAAADPKNYVYAISDQKELLKAVAQWYERRYGVNLNPDTEICSLLGSQEGLAHIALSIADEEIPEEVAEKARLMVISYPNNPTTVMAPDSFYEEVIAFAKKHDVIVLHDNAYSELVFDGRTCGSFLRFPGAKEVGVEFNSLSKTYGLAGARIGFCVGNEEVVSHLKMLKSNMDYGMFLPVQMAAIAAVTGDQACVEETRKAYERRRDALCDGMTAIGWRMEKPEATMFVWAKIPDNFTDSSSFAMELAEKSGLLVTPGSAFGPSGEGYVRLALVQDEDVLKKAARLVDESGMLR